MVNFKFVKSIFYIQKEQQFINLSKNTDFVTNLHKIM